MKIHFNFDTATRSIHLIPEGALEQLALEEMAKECEKGNLPKLREETKLTPDNGTVDFYVLEFKLNGHHKDQLVK